MFSLDERLKHKYLAKERVTRRERNANARKPAADKSMKSAVIIDVDKKPKV